MKFDVKEYVEDHLTNVRSTSSGELTAECPWCERWGGFYVNLETGNYICFKCDERGRHLIGLVAQVEGISWHEAKRMVLKRAVQFRRKKTPQTLLETIRNLRPSDDRKGIKGDNHPVEVELPDEFIPVYKAGKWKYPSYLKQRGIKKNTAKVWDIGFCNKGKYEGRIIIPVECPEGHSFTARDSTGEQYPKILNPPRADHGRLLVGWKHLVSGQDVVLVEGPFDAVKLWQHGYPSIGLMGKVLHQAQMRQINRWPRDTAITIALDPEEAEAPYSIAAQLSCRFDNLYIAQFPPGIDPGASTKKQAREALENASEYTGQIDALVKKIAVTRKKLAEKYQ